MFDKIMKIRKNGVIFPFIFLLAVSPMLLKWGGFGIQERFSSPLSIVLDLVFLLACYFFYDDHKEFKNFYLLLLVNVISLAITFTFYAGMGVVLVYINMLLAINLFNTMEFSKEECAALHLSVSVLLGIWLACVDTSQVANAYMCEPNGLYINPCTFGLVALAFYYHATIAVNLLFQKKEKWKELFHIGLFLIGLYLVYLSACRASLLSFLAFAVIQVYKEFVAKNYRKILRLFLIASFVFPFAYLAIYYVIGGFNFFGKNFFTGRQILWESTLKLIFNNPVFGSGSGATIWYKDVFYDDPHHLFFGLWKAIGIIPVISLFIVLGRGKNIKNPTSQQILPKIMFLTCLIISTVETVLNGSEFYIFFFTLLITCRENNDQLTKPLFKE